MTSDASKNSPRLIGYSDMCCNDPRGQYFNWRTMRAMVVAVDGSQRREIGGSLINEPNVWTQMAGWSPDGRFAIVHRSFESEENFAWERANKTFRMDTGGWLLDACLVDLATGRAENPCAVDRVSSYNTGMFFWPGDPNSLGFTALIKGVSHPFRMDRDGRNKRDLTNGAAGFTYGYSASPDGRYVAYHKSYQVHIANADGSNIRRIDTGHPFHFNPQWSPDGQWLLFLDGEHYDCHPTLVRPDGTGLRRIASRRGYTGVIELLDHPDFHSASSDTPVWSNDGQWIYFTAKIDGNVELMRVNIDGDEQRLTKSRPNSGILHNHPHVAPDHQWVAFGSTRDGARALYASRLDGSDVHQLTTPVPGRAQMHVHWSPIA